MVGSVSMVARAPVLIATLSLFALNGCGGDAAEQSVAIQLWREGQPVFGIFVPSERPPGERGPDGERLPAVYTSEGGAQLAQNDLLDYLFLNLESSYDAEAISAISDGLGNEGTAERKTLLVRIPPIPTDGQDAA